MVEEEVHGSFLIRHQRGHPGVALPLVISNSANRYERMQLELNPIRNESCVGMEVGMEVVKHHNMISYD